MGAKSNYFRHSFNAHSDPKIRRLIQRKGALGYAAYFMLLELYCSKIFDDDLAQSEQEVDLKLLGSCLGVRSDSAHSCLIVMSELELIGHLSSKYDQTMVKLSIPKSLKYFGKYKNVSDEKLPNKRKEKKTKLNETREDDNAPIDAVVADDIVAPLPITPDELVHLFNKTFRGKLRPAISLGCGDHLQNFRATCRLLKTRSDWENLIATAASQDWLVSGAKTPLTLTWLVIEENAIKVLEGKYGESPAAERARIDADVDQIMGGGTNVR
jgi:hypothetical protein